MVVAISNRAVLVVDPTTKEFLEEFPYTKLVTWGHSEKAFVIVSGDLIHQRKIYFKTNQVKPLKADEKRDASVSRTSCLFVRLLMVSF